MAPTQPDETPIHSTLESIQDAANQIIEGVELNDPDAVNDALGHGLAQLMADPQPEPQRDFGLMVRDLCDQVRRQERAKALVQYVGKTSMTPPQKPPGMLEALIQRLCHLALDHAGDEGDLLITVRQQDGRPCLDMVTRCPLGKHDEVPPELHFRSLESFARDMNAGLCWMGAGREIEFQLRF